MLFFDYAFLLGFLPAALLGHLLLLKYKKNLVVSWLGACSLLFYMLWEPKNLIPLGVSIIFNYAAGAAILNTHAASRRKKILVLSLALNILFLGFYKYRTFLESLLQGADPLTQKNSLPQDLPLGISFFTFTQIAYLVDCARQRFQNYRFQEYLLFVTYFPHLIAGPIMHHQEMMPQFSNLTRQTYQWENLSLGLSMFVVGLLKKTLIADYFSPAVKVVFDTSPGATLTFIEAWVGTFAYSIQIYFDFSGYCDMALGISKMFGVRLPLNFFAPYQATSFIDFWRRWHMTLGRFLRDYVYIPLGGNKNGTAFKMINLILTMLIGGVWHGAGWTFIIWGLIHGALLALNHGVRHFLKPAQSHSFLGAFLRQNGKKLGVFIGVSLAWVPFRAPSAESMLAVWKACFGLNGVAVPKHFLLGKVEAVAPFLQKLGVHVMEFVPVHSVAMMAIVLVVLPLTLFMPNALQIFRKYAHDLAYLEQEKHLASFLKSPHPRFLTWAPTIGWALTFAFALILGFWVRHETVEFLYFQF